MRTRLQALCRSKSAKLNKAKPLCRSRRTRLRILSAHNVRTTLAHKPVNNHYAQPGLTSLSRLQLQTACMSGAAVSAMHVHARPMSHSVCAQALRTSPPHNPRAQPQRTRFAHNPPAQPQALCAQGFCFPLNIVGEKP